MAKYNNKKITIDGICFDSKEEARYYEYLKKKKAAEEILNFELQPSYTLLEKFTNNEGNLVRAITYTADFRVYHVDGSEEIVDIKGMETQQGIMRRKLFWSRYPNIKLSWICRNLKYGDPDGWIHYDELKRRRRK